MNGAQNELARSLAHHIANEYLVCVFRCCGKVAWPVSNVQGNCREVGRAQICLRMFFKPKISVKVSQKKIIIKK